MASSAHRIYKPPQDDGEEAKSHGWENKRLSTRSVRLGFLAGHDWCNRNLYATGDLDKFELVLGGGRGCPVGRIEGHAGVHPGNGNARLADGRKLRRALV
jgi:hypothetical protein